MKQAVIPEQRTAGKNEATIHTVSDHGIDLRPGTRALQVRLQETTVSFLKGQWFPPIFF